VSAAEVARGIKTGDYAQGTFHASKENSNEGYVTVQGMDRQPLLVGPHMNRAVDRDIVCVRLHAKADWVRAIPPAYLIAR
jgi:hypothetical protein